MTRADFIREFVAANPHADTFAVQYATEDAGFQVPSRQAIESALAKSATRGRPTERAKCPLCGTRVDVDECTADERERFELLCDARGYRPIDIVRAGLRVVGDFESGDERAREWARPTVATVSQTPKRQSTKRTPRTISRSKK